MKEPGHRSRKEEFFALIAEGTSTAEASKRLGVHSSTAYNWIHQQKKQRSAKEVVFAQLAPVSQSQQVELRVSGATIMVSRGFDPALLRQVIAALTGAGA